ncbi:hypothetical protein IWQ61_002036 [Dispira simplex]|nr:hypothetical protein IWQ61_002036 [Dispira simplex]
MKVQVMNAPTSGKPRPFPPRVTHAVFKLLEDEHRNDLFGDNAIELELILPEERKKMLSGKAAQAHQVSISLVDVINTTELYQYIRGHLPWSPTVLKATKALDTVVNHWASTHHYSVGRSIFTGGDARSLSYGLDVWFGLFQSVRPVVGQLILNVDSSTHVFYTLGNALELAGGLANRNCPTKDLRAYSLNRSMHTRLSSFFDGAVVCMKFPNVGDRRYTIKRILFETPMSATFERKHPNGTSDLCTVAQYFQETYGITLNYPNAPCVQTRGGQVLPLELCEVMPGSRYGGKLSDYDTSAMIKQTCVRPFERFQNMQIKSREILSLWNNSYLKEFGMSIEDKFSITNARVLPMPELKYKQSSNGRVTDQLVVPTGGSWNMMKKRVNRSCFIKDIGVLVVSRNNNANSMIQSFIENLLKQMSFLGIGYNGNQNPHTMYSNSLYDIAPALQNLHREMQGQRGKNDSMIFVILDNEFKSSVVYGEVKRVSDTLLGIPTQCVLMSKLYNARPQYFANLLLKVNVKLGGLNAALRNGILERMYRSAPTLVIGADVSHPGPGNNSQPSIAAVVGSVDEELGKYTSCVSYQTPHQEIIEDLESIMVKILRGFQAGSQRQPECIIFYRDGVSETQFNQLCDAEVEAIQQACRKAFGDPNYKAKVTFITCQKRHHIRSNPTQAQFRDQKSQNAPAGTVVNQGITHPYGYDFYLQSQGGLQGISRPVHYTVLVDENLLSPDDLQGLTNELCYLFPRCTRSVSLCTAAYFAHVLASRARVYRRVTEKPNERASSTQKRGQAPGSVNFEAQYRPVKESLEVVLYYV